jgi:hypothetical protein
MAAAQESGVGPPVAQEPVIAETLVAPTPTETPALTVSPGFEGDRWISPAEAWHLQLSRPLEPGDGRLAVFVGRTDVTALTTLRDARVAYHPARIGLPAGETELAVYLVTGSGSWQEIGRMPIRLLTRSGFEQAAVAPKVDLAMDGQIDQGRTPSSVLPERGFYQDLTANLGFESGLARGGWSFKSRANAVGVSRDEQRLRFGERGLEAPVVDLSDYLLEMNRGPTTLAVGHTSFGANRHLVNGFSSRGVVGGVRMGPAAHLGLAALNGSSQVGWSNPVGLSRPDHRIWSATLGVEMEPARPGGVHLDATVMDGSVLPIAGFNQGVVNDAEESRGVGVQLAASDARQRVRLAGGLSRSRFVNPADDLLGQGTALVPVRPSSRTARYLESTVQLLQSRPLGKHLVASLSGGFRHRHENPVQEWSLPNLSSNQTQFTPATDLPLDSPVRWSVNACTTAVGCGSPANAQQIRQLNWPPLFSFATELAPTFRHERCVNCHAVVATNFARVTPGLGAAHPSVAATTNCQTCHTNTLLPTQGTINPGWHAAPASMDLRNLTDAQLCQRATNPGSVAGSVLNHLTQDKLILWAIADGRLPNSITKPTAPPNSISTWQARVQSWINAGMPPCN